MIHPNVTHLYLYKPPNDYTLDIFKKDLLWASKPEAFNDPFDCDLEASKGIAEADVLAAFRATYGAKAKWPADIVKYHDKIFDQHGKFVPAERQRIDDEIKAFIQENRDSGVVCLAEANDIILMWAHYAASHTGICIEFERTPKSALGDAELCEPVKYDSKYPVIDLGKMLLHRDGQTQNLMMRYKADCWAYEKEWRIIADKGNINCSLPGKITKVILGISIKPEFLAKVKDLCDKKGIPLAQAKKGSMEFKIEVP
jgi:hypothetical protein